MTLEEIWATLGIAETRDRGGVRRAYAQRLKETHPEDDPEGFKALREAYEIALAFAEGRLVREEDLEDTPPPAPLPPADRPGPEDAINAVAVHFAACNALIGQIEHGAPEPELVAAFQAILRAPILENLTVFEQTSVGLARALLANAPKGAGLVGPLIDYSGWKDAQDRWDSPAEITQLLAYRQMLADRHNLRESHPRAYALLTSAPPRRRTREFNENARHVARLLGIARRTEEWVVEEFDPASLKWWEERASWNSRRSSSEAVSRLGCFAALFIVGFIIICGLVAGFLADGSSSSTESLDTAALESAAGINQSPEMQRAAEACARDATSMIPVTPQNCDAAYAYRPGSTAVRISRAYYNLKFGPPDKAEADFAWIIQKIPGNAFAWFGRSLARSKMGDSDGSHADLCRALQISPSVQHQVEEAYHFQVSLGRSPCAGP